MIDDDRYGGKPAIWPRGPQGTWAMGYEYGIEGKLTPITSTQVYPDDCHIDSPSGQCQLWICQLRDSEIVFKRNGFQAKWLYRLRA